MKRWFDEFNKAQEAAFESFQEGVRAYATKAKFPEALNEGDYSGYFWAGFEAARIVANLAEKDSTSTKSSKWVHGYDEPKVKITRKYRR